MTLTREEGAATTAGKSKRELTQVIKYQKSAESASERQKDPVSARYHRLLTYCIV
jgi:hypothetical protein